MTERARRLRALKLEIGKVYRDGWNEPRVIMGLAKCGPVAGEVVYWSLQGDWYTESGKKCIGDRLWHPDGGPHDLQEEVNLEEVNLG